MLEVRFQALLSTLALINTIKKNVIPLKVFL